MPELQFKGKEFVYNHHLTVPYRPLEMDASKSIGEPNLNGNLIIHGDNLHALKALMPLYAGKVDCIFIDPPYNTGNENWSYNDNVNSPMMREWLSSNPVTIEDGLRHDKWCAMMYPRLKLLHELLSENGSFWMTLDDNEVHHAKTILDEVFGEEHFVVQLIWKSRKAEDTRALSGISTDHEYILCYAKNGAFRASGVAIDETKFANPDADERGPWRSADMTGLATRDQRPNLHYPLTDPKTDLTYPCPERGWRYEQSEMLRRVKEHRILWPSDSDGRPRQKLFLRELQRTTKNFSSVITFTSTGDGSKEIDSIFGARVFDFPKPSALIQFLIEQSTSPDALVLDSFAGSGSTGHAVLAANVKDAGARRFILVESEVYADTLTAERLRRVIRGKLEAPATLLSDGLGGDFTFCTLGEPLDLDKILTGETLPDYESIGAWLFHTATGESLNTSKVKKSLWFLGESSAYHVWLVYKPDLDFLKSNKAALTLELAQKIASDPDRKGKRHLVFAPAKYASNKTLLPLGVEYAPLPFALYRVEKD